MFLDFSNVFLILAYPDLAWQLQLSFIDLSSSAFVVLSPWTATL